MAYNIHFPTALGAGTGGTAAPVIHCFGAQRGRRGLPRSENEANSHWSVLKTRAFWSEVVSLWGTHFEFFLWLFFFEIAIGFLAIALLPWKRSDLFQTFKRHLCHMSINPTLAKKNWNSLQLHDHHLPPHQFLHTLRGIIGDIISRTDKAPLWATHAGPIGSELRNT